MPGGRGYKYVNPDGFLAKVVGGYGYKDINPNGFPDEVLVAHSAYSEYSAVKVLSVFAALRLCDFALISGSNNGASRKVRQGRKGETHLPAEHTEYAEKNYSKEQGNEANRVQVAGFCFSTGPWSVVGYPLRKKIFNR